MINLNNSFSSNSYLNTTRPEQSAECDIEGFEAELDRQYSHLPPYLRPQVVPAGDFDDAMKFLNENNASLGLTMPSTGNTNFSETTNNISSNTSSNTSAPAENQISQLLSSLIAILILSIAAMSN
ncbi:hypothetical protein [uncultured Thiothrix sp.]|uniref:hypothetical protein n=1 Tax=uncultured Thiothrix sp. TaxID=223185 RepID=UPI00262A66F8|nr:hypothetical protein [uncultured Thiothrix sp.]